MFNYCLKTYISFLSFVQINTLEILSEWTQRQPAFIYNHQFIHLFIHLFMHSKSTCCILVMKCAPFQVVRVKRKGMPWPLNNLLLRAKVLEKWSGVPGLFQILLKRLQRLNYFYNNIKTLFTFFTFILCKVYSKVFQTCTI